MTGIPLESTATSPEVDRGRPRAWPFLVAFLWVWGIVGLVTGTLVLVVLVRGIIAVLQHFGWGQTAQDRTLMAVILGFVFGSFLLARWYTRRLWRQRTTTRRLGLAWLVLPAAVCMWAWSNPTRLLAGAAGGGISSTLHVAGGPTFLFGSYPDYDRLAKLKKEGVTTIVSLQHPGVLVEIQGIDEEKDAAKRLGLNFVQAPMLPWVSDNTAAIEQIRQIALHGKGTYYVHCGLGRDRVNIAKRVIASVESQSHAHLADNGTQHAAGFETRTTPFQRGRLVHTASAWVVPFPNAAEFYGYIVQGDPGHVWLALNPRDTLQAKWVATAHKTMQQYAVPFTDVPFDTVDAAAATQLAARVRSAKGVNTVIVPTTGFTSNGGPPAVRVLEAGLGAQ